MPGPFDARLDDSHASELPAQLAAATGLPVLLENDATAAALGERLYGAGRALRNFFLVYVGVGLGGGLILDGAPYKGAWGNAGELGHVVVDPGGRPCPCGNRGCLEAYFSLAAARAALGTGELGASELGMADLDARLSAGDAAVTRWLDDAAARLAVALAGVENLLDPEAILIGGDASPHFLDAVLARLGALPPTVSARRERATPRILKATAGEDAGALGAAALPIFDMLRPSFRPILAPRSAGGGAARARPATPA
jgi:predicted NBD/HSP70 family sugar kinase